MRQQNGGHRLCRRVYNASVRLIDQREKVRTLALSHPLRPSREHLVARLGISLDVIHLYEIIPDGHLVLDSQKASMSNFPHVGPLPQNPIIPCRARESTSWNAERKVLPNHLQKGRMDMENRTSWHMQQQGSQRLRHGFSDRRDHLSKLSVPCSHSQKV